MSNGNESAALGTTSSAGVLRGKTITLDDAVPPLDGQRVRVVIEPEEEPRVTAQEQTALWKHWAEWGPQGPIEDEGEAEFP